MTVTLKSLTQGRELTLNDYASIAADALAAINAINKTWTDSVKAGGYATHFRDCPSIHDDFHTELLEAIVGFDSEPVETLAELQFQNEPRERDWKDTGLDAAWELRA